MQTEIDNIIDLEFSKFTYVSKIDMDCFKTHRISPKLIQISKDTEGTSWVDCYLVTDHNGKDDSPYRIAFDPQFKQFLREVILKNDVPYYYGRYPDLESALDDYA